MPSEQDYSIDVDYGPRDKYGVSLARYKEIAADADTEAARQKEASKPLAGVREPDVFDRAMEKRGREKDVFDRAMEARKAKQALAEGTPSELNAMRGRLGMERSDKPGEPGFAKKAYDFMGGRTGIGATAGGILGTALGPSTGGLSILIPALAAGAGGAAGAITEGKNPITQGLKEGALQGVGGFAGKAARPAWQFAKESVMKTFGSRELVSEAGENVLRRWLSPATRSADLYAIGQGMTQAIPPTETTRVVNDFIRTEIGRLPLDTQREVLRILRPIRSFYQPRTASGRQYFVAQEVPDFMAEVRRLRLESARAYKAGNSDLGNAINTVRGAMLDDMEAHGAGVVVEASRAYRREMAIEDLSRQISRPNPGVKIRDYARDHPLFRQAFTPAEREQIDRIVKKIAFVAPSGASGVLGKIATTSAGGVLGGPVGGIVGYIAPEYIRTLLASPVGRDFMERTLEGTYRMGQGRFVQSVGPVWSIFARGLMGQSGEPEQ